MRQLHDLIAATVHQRLQHEEAETLGLFVLDLWGMTSSWPAVTTSSSTGPLCARASVTAVSNLSAA
jgi:hypothetical protein